MDNVMKAFPGGLPTLAQIRAHNEGKDVPPETAWIWGKDDELGRINLLTSDRVRSAKEMEIKDGDVVSLNWSMNLPRKPAFNRPPCKHTLKAAEGRTVFDDSIDMNTQSGSQWDGFRHFGHQASKRFYNNLTTQEVETGTRCGIHALSDHGIVGRGVLLDYHSWKLKRGETYDAFSTHSILLSELLEVAKSQKVTFETGDILLVRSGYTSQYYDLEKSNPEKLEAAGVSKPKFAGVEQTEEVKSWLHDSYFSAVAGDAPSFEAWPTKQKWTLHEYILACWGMPIGEMFDLEELSKKCEEKQRWSFFFMSTPLNMPGGIASLANAMAIL